MVKVWVSPTGWYLGSDGGASILTARPLSYTGTYMSVPSAFRWARLPFPLRKRMAIFLMVSAGLVILKKLRRLPVMVNCHLLDPADTALAAAAVLPQVKGTYFQSDESALRLVITPICT